MSDSKKTPADDQRANGDRPVKAQTVTGDQPAAKSPAKTPRKNGQRAAAGGARNGNGNGRRTPAVQRPARNSADPAEPIARKQGDTAPASGGSQGAALEDGVSEAAAEATIAALVEAERAAEAEEQAVAVAEAAAENESPAEPAAENETTAEPVVATSAKPRTQPVRRLAVIGSPIEHSRSPELHRAAYAALGLDWVYEPVDVAEEALEGFMAGLGDEWRGLSLTMPLKKAVLPLLTETEGVAEQIGVANTVLLDGGAVRGFNTDAPGIVRAVRAAGLERIRYAHVLGGGATAASALVAAAELGAELVDVHVRDLEKSVWLEPLAHQLGLMVRIRSFAQADRGLGVPELVISTLPGGTATIARYTDSTRRKALLMDVAYDPWPSALAASWLAVGGRVVSGLGMLAQQALLQVRIFVSGDPLQPLPDEDAVLGAMLEAVGVDASGSLLADATPTEAGNSASTT